MTFPEKRRCRNCCYWVAPSHLEKHRTHDAVIGECRRRSPQGPEQLGGITSPQRSIADFYCGEWEGGIWDKPV
jgi:hypothetical protein